MFFLSHTLCWGVCLWGRGGGGVEKQGMNLIESEVLWGYDLEGFSCPKFFSPPVRTHSCFHNIFVLIAWTKSVQIEKQRDRKNRWIINIGPKWILSHFHIKTDYASDRD